MFHASISLAVLTASKTFQIAITTAFKV